MKKKRKLFTLSDEAVEFLNHQDNQSGLVESLIMKHIHRETRSEYVWGVIEEYTLTNAHPETLITLITNLSLLLRDAIIGVDVLPEIMKGVKK